MQRYLAFCVALTMTAFLACARQPTTGHTQKLIQHHFVHYGKKYPSSVFGQSAVTGVTVEGIEELHKNYVAAAARITFGDGHTEAVRCSIENQVPLGWRVVSWERLEQGSKP